MASERTLSLVRDDLMPHFYETIPGFFWFQEAYDRLLKTLPTDKPSHFVEIGSFQGKSLAWLGVEAINRRIPVTLHAVDSFVAWPGMPQGEDLRKLFDAHTAPIREALGDRLKVWPLPSLEAAQQFADESLDVAFVDGDHEYAAVKADILTWFPKLKPGGFMGGDDWCMKPVADAVAEIFAPSGYILVHGWGTVDGIMQPWPSWIARKA